MMTFEEFKASNPRSVDVQRDFATEEAARTFINETHKIMTVYEDEDGHEKYFVTKHRDAPVYSCFIMIEYTYMTEICHFEHLHEALTYAITTQFYTYLRREDSNETALMMQLSTSLRDCVKTSIANTINAQQTVYKEIIAAM